MVSSISDRACLCERIVTDVAQRHVREIEQLHGGDGRQRLDATIDGGGRLQGGGEGQQYKMWQQLT